MFWIRVLSLLPLFFSIALEQFDDIDCKSYVLMGYRNCDLVSFFLCNSLDTSWEYLAQVLWIGDLARITTIYIYFFFNCLNTLVWQYILNSVKTASLLGLFKYYSIFFKFHYMFLKYYLILILWIGGLWGLHFCFLYSYELSCYSSECSSFIKYSCVCCVQDIFLLWYENFEFVWRALQTCLMPFWICMSSMKPNMKM
jgi:hypothetical protein